MVVNKSTGCVWVGNPESGGDAVEFMDNAVAVVDDKELVALWPTQKNYRNIKSVCENSLQMDCFA